MILSIPRLCKFEW